MKKNKLKTEMTSIFDVLFTRMDEEAKADPLFAFIENRKQWLGDPEEMGIMISFEFNSIINSLVKQTLNTNDNIICDIYTDWSLFDNHVTNLCSKLYGGGCSADRGRFIVKSFIKYRLTGELPVFDPKPENYHHPETGTPEQWMNFVEGVGHLKYGHLEKYLLAYKELLITGE
jgi:hypothetical protein